ncbi:MAG: GNAT family N-acetyltransferase [Silvibacterium sp.]
MTEHADKPSAHIELLPATREQQPILANLLELYMYDFSEFHHAEIGEDGKFDYKHLALYWSHPGRHPFLIRIDGKLAGLVFVKRGSDVSGNETVWDMAEFFVLRRYWRQGIGTKVAHEVWRHFPGRWEVRVMQSNVSAHHFWARTISKFTGEATAPVRVEKAGECWQFFSFESRHIE